MFWHIDVVDDVLVVRCKDKYQLVWTASEQVQAPSAMQKASACLLEGVKTFDSCLT